MIHGHDYYHEWADCSECNPFYHINPLPKRAVDRCNYCATPLDSDDPKPYCASCDHLYLDRNEWPDTNYQPEEPR